MKDYQKLLAKWPDSFPTRDQVIEYLDKYWLDEKELDDKWLKIRKSIFKGDFRSPKDAILNDDFDIIILKGGAVLYRYYFEQLKYCISVIGDKEFVLIEDYDKNNPPGNLPPSPGLIDWPPLRFKFNADIKFDEVMSGGVVSFDVIEMPERDYFVFGDSGHWGIYAGDDFEFPLHFIGFKKAFSELFHKIFVVPEEDIQDLKEWTAHYGIKLPVVD